MTTIRKDYLCKLTAGSNGRKRGMKTYRNWWLAHDRIYVGEVKIPNQYIGKHLCFKVEIVDDPPPKEDDC